ncbi:MAG: hypothetical protein JW847_04705 [Candidatus Omnitrophica bacterium]|nr:hypothetical protein [Candidatus Omnitrophota bacterium]
MKSIIVFLVLMGLSGCGFVFQNFNQDEPMELTYGMSKQEVMRIVGEPQNISIKEIDGKEYQVWEYPDENRKAVEKMRALGIIYSQVFFLDGKLVQRDKNRVYAQPEYGFTETIDSGGGVNTTADPEQEDNF